MIPSLAELLKKATVEGARDARVELTAERLGDHAPGDRVVRSTPVPENVQLAHLLVKLERTL